MYMYLYPYSVHKYGIYIEPMVVTDFDYEISRPGAVSPLRYLQFQAIFTALSSTLYIPACLYRYLILLCCLSSGMYIDTYMYVCA